MTASVGLLSCELDKFPNDSYNEGNYNDPSKGETGNQYSTREDIKGQLDAMYNSIKNDIQEPGYSDMMLLAEVRCDLRAGGGDLALDDFEVGGSDGNGCADGCVSHDGLLRDRL